jgi:selenocysteine lyase/cysteine desulfurase
MYHQIPTLAEIPAQDVGGVLQTEYNIIVATVYVYNTHWFRLSANLYNTMDDYIALADAVLLLMAAKQNVN